MFVCIVIGIKVSKIKVSADSFSNVEFCTSEMVLFVMLDLYVAREENSSLLQLQKDAVSS